MTLLIFIIVWIASGVRAYGLSLYTLQKIWEWSPDIQKERLNYHRRISTLAFALGPIGLVLALFQQFQDNDYGWRP